MMQMKDVMKIYQQNGLRSNLLQNAVNRFDFVQVHLVPHQICSIINALLERKIAIAELGKLDGNSLTPLKHPPGCCECNSTCKTIAAVVHRRGQLRSL